MDHHRDPAEVRALATGPLRAAGRAAARALPDRLTALAPRVSVPAAAATAFLVAFTVTLVSVAGGRDVAQAPAALRLHRTVAPPAMAQVPEPVRTPVPRRHVHRPDRADPVAARASAPSERAPTAVPQPAPPGPSAEVPAPPPPAPPAPAPPPASPPPASPPPPTRVAPPPAEPAPSPVPIDEPEFESSGSFDSSD